MANESDMVATASSTALSTIDVNVLYSVTGQQLTVTGADEIDNLIYNLIKTVKNTRRFRPNVGSRVLEIVQEPGGQITALNIQNALTSEITQQVRRAEVLRVDVSVIPFGFFILVTYRDKKLGIIKQFSTTLSANG